MNLPRLALIALASAAMGGCLSSEEPTTDEAGGGDGNDIAQPGNSAPVISGNPDTAVMTGGAYSFKPSASDPNGDALTFAVTNLPLWASFNTSSGTLSGQPVLGDEGTYTNITISVSDGSTTVYLPAFSIVVTQVALGSMTLNWNPPTQNADGTPLTDLAGYRFYFGTASGWYTSQVRVDSPGITTYVVENLLPGTYYVAARAINADGAESGYSNEAVYTVTGR